MKQHISATRRAALLNGPPQSIIKLGTRHTLDNSPAIRGQLFTMTSEAQRLNDGR